MRIDYASFCIGLLAGFTVFLCAAVLLDARGIGAAEFCHSGESVLSCVREWADLVAIAAGFLTVLFILFQMKGTEKQHRDVMALQTFEMKATIARFVVEVIEPLETDVDLLEKVRALSENGKWSKIHPEQVHTTLTNIQHKLNFSLKNIAQYDDGTLIDLRDSAQIIAFTTQMAWQRIDERYNATVPLLAATAEAVATLNPAIAACGRFIEASRSLHELVAGGAAPTVKKRYRLPQTKI